MLIIVNISQYTLKNQNFKIKSENFNNGKEYNLCLLIVFSFTFFHFV